MMCSYKKRRETHQRMPWEDKGGRGDAVTSQGHQEARNRHRTDSASEPQKEPTLPTP